MTRKSTFGADPPQKDGPHRKEEIYKLENKFPKISKSTQFYSALEFYSAPICCPNHFYPRFQSLHQQPKREEVLQKERREEGKKRKKEAGKKNPLNIFQPPYF